MSLLCTWHLKDAFYFAFVMLHINKESYVLGHENRTESDLAVLDRFNPKFLEVNVTTL